MRRPFAKTETPELVRMMKKYFRAKTPVTCVRGHELCGCSSNPADEKKAPCSREVRDEQERRVAPAQREAGASQQEPKKEAA